MIHNLNDEWRVTTDRYNFILERLVKPSKPKKDGTLGDPRWVQQGFYASVDDVIRGYAKTLINEADTADEAVTALRAVADECRNLSTEVPR